MQVIGMYNQRQYRITITAMKFWMVNIIGKHIIQCAHSTMCVINNDTIRKNRICPKKKSKNWVMGLFVSRMKFFFPLAWSYRLLVRKHVLFHNSYRKTNPSPTTCSKWAIKWLSMIKNDVSMRVGTVQIGCDPPQSLGHISLITSPHVLYEFRGGPTLFVWQHVHTFAMWQSPTQESLDLKIGLYKVCVQTHILTIATLEVFVKSLKEGWYETVGLILL